ncbi:nicotinate-nucleotide--dimethylbenzimidazole phosphoribosyltransferase [Leeia sp. TBRC 13508]|uniref:Nicotinate-nucleotide--dimethylbenzimidazole phosphoribosyltransferase n=1 Tax=Leeia speluncae TaxID=2884804 RepID=A0ABS8D327_9NEIS|nr:nicotinate-nucleotide--dimethylbenzimidazole phosphoribosyltransferase [Leeia speluncae]MCB6182562.1 nicotinate-nucleotide--dimethylbenzimidazole phosphoribosyltransferase [Leeia speluncae]
MNWIFERAKPFSQDAKMSALRRQLQLTKPQGSLGELESLVVHLAGLQGVDRPHIRAPWVTIFAADHGIATEGVSAYPQEVTFQMVANFAAGGAAASVLAKQHNARFEIVDVGVIGDTSVFPSVFVQKVAAGTQNCLHHAAMTDLQLKQAMKAGAEAAARAQAGYADLFIAGEMGIGNTTIASALLAALANVPIEQVTGAGTGISSEKIAYKQSVIQKILSCHSHSLSVTEKLAAMGGFEVVAMAGAYIRAAQLGMPILVDGFISSVAALYACNINHSVREWLFFGHLSDERAHQLVLDLMGAKPMLALNMRLGEASGALMALPILRLACELHEQMATFAEAGVANKET